MTTTRKICWLFGIYFACFFLYQGYLHRSSMGWSTTPAVEVDWKKPFVMSCEHVRGMDWGRPGHLYKESDVFITNYTDKSISFSRYFYNDRKKEVGIFFWDKANHMKEGSWSQEDPFDHGKWSMEGTPETGFTGWLTNNDGLKIPFSLRMK